MTTQAKLLVAADSVADATMIERLLHDEFPEVRTSTDAMREVADFEDCEPDVLILAFNTLEKAERYYLGLYRLSARIHGIPHRAIILCNKDQVRRVYELCRQEYFDDYVLFWPLTHDAPRLLMAVHLSLRQMEETASRRPAIRELAAQARRIGGLEKTLQRHIEQGRRNLDAAGAMLRETGREIDGALDGFSRSLTDGSRVELIEIRDPVRLRKEIDRLKTNEIGNRLASFAGSVDPMLRQWVEGLEREVAPQLESARRLKILIDRIKPRAMVVDDDPFQRRLAGTILEQAGIESLPAENGLDALRLLRRTRPDIILMDYRMPDPDGIETTRRLKAIATLAAIPIIMVTGQSEKKVAMESLQAGAIDFIVKPFDREIMLKKICRAIGSAGLDDTRA